MSSYYRDPTANAAMGAVDKEMKRMKKRAEKLRELRDLGKLTPEAEALARRQFTGIFRPILRKAMED